MGFSGSGYKKNHTFPRKRPAGPIKLAFGVVADSRNTEASVSNITSVTPVIKVTEPVFERQEIKGYMDHAQIKYAGAPPINPDYKKRLLQNLKQIYEEGLLSHSKNVVDCSDNELNVSFPFDSTLVDRIKGLDRTERAWEPDKKFWRVFIGAFDEVLDVLGRGVKISQPAYFLMIEFIETDYYRFLFKNKLAKLIVRESWFREDGFIHLPAVSLLPGSNAWVAKQPIENDSFLDDIESLRSKSFARNPFAHQLQGIAYLMKNDCCALLDEMGCGKSFQIAAAIHLLFSNNVIDRTVIVAPKSLIKTWQNELAMATSLPYVVCSGGPTQRKKSILAAQKIILIHYEGLRLEHEQITNWLKNGRGVLVFDESQRIKNLESQTTQAALKIRSAAQRCIIATGTPIANRPIDLFSQYLVLDEGRTFGRKFHEFKTAFCEMETRQFSVGRKTIRKEYFIGIRNGSELKLRIAQTALRRLKSEVLDLPPIVFKDYAVELTGLQKSHYQQMRDHLRIEVSGMSEAEVTSQASTIAVKLIRLAQIASNPQLLTPDYRGPNAKFSELDELLEDILIDDTKKIIIWSHYVDNVKFLTAKYSENYGAVSHTGDMAVEARSQSVETFRTDPGCRLFIATPQSAKEGLTLLPYDQNYKTDTMVYVDLSFDGGAYIQSQARFHRIGQTADKCLVIHLLAEGTVDEKMRDLIVSKLSTAKALLDNPELTDSVLVDSGTFQKETLLSFLE